MPVFVFADPVLPLKQIWMIGEGFLRSTFATLQSLKTVPTMDIDDNSQDGQSVMKIPYINYNYQITPFYQQSAGSAEGTLVNLYNSVVEAMNKSNVVPEYLLLFPDKDIILELNYFVPGTLFILDQEMQWLTKNIDRLIITRHEQLRHKSPGAVGSQPKLVWIQMIHRPYIRNHPYATYNLVVELRHKFNQFLEQEARKSMFAYVLEMEDTSQNPDFFDSTGNLTFAILNHFESNSGNTWILK